MCRGERSTYDLEEGDNLALLRERFKAGVCEMTGIPFDMNAAGKRRWNSPSIDRIDSRKGYVYGNVRFILWSVNASLSNWGEAVFELIAAAWMYRKAHARCPECRT